jgi:hypothetical protein
VLTLSVSVSTCLVLSDREARVSVKEKTSEHMLVVYLDPQVATL